MKHIGNLKYAEGSKKGKKRIARGAGSGYGGTSTKGHKGQKSRSGAKIFVGFEGGQMPLNRRVPKFGFYNRFRVSYQVINVATLQELCNDGKIDNKVDFETLYNLGLLSKKNKPLKILGNGDLSTSLQVTAHHFSNTAIQKIESAGGTVTIDG